MVGVISGRSDDRGNRSCPLQFQTDENVDQHQESQALDFEPDMKKISQWMQRYFYAVALQGTMQVAIIVVVMMRLRVGVRAS
jgi:hypothetical protein